MQNTCEEVAVDVWLFGALAGLSEAKPLRLPVVGPATVKTILFRVADATSPAFHDIVFNADGTKKRLCKLFLNGEQVDLEDQLPRERSVIDFELIVLTAIEGG